MFGEIDVIMRRDDRDLRPLAAFGPVNALARMPARLNARRGRRYAADELRVEAFDAVRVHHHSPDCRFVRLSARNAAHERIRAEAQRSQRSEEHTSELQSLMRISYAVF